jgi:tetratricopeptide (TPR) repeat protein
MKINVQSKFFIAAFIVVLLNFTESKSNIDSLLIVIESKPKSEQVAFINSLIGTQSILSAEDKGKLYEIIFQKVYESGTKYEIARALSNYGYFLTFTNRYHEAIDTILKAQQIFHQIGSKIEEAFAYSQLALAYQSLSNFDKAIEYNLKINTIIDKDTIQSYLKNLNKFKDNEKDSISRIIRIYALILTDFGLLHYELQDMQSAREKFNECLTIARLQNDENRIASSLSNLAMVERDAQNIDLATKLYLEALENAEKAGNNNYIASILNNLGNVYSQRQLFHKSLEYYQKALDINLALNRRTGVILVSYNIAKVHIDLKNVQKALELSLSAYETSINIGSLDNMAKGADLLSTIYDSLGNYKEALKYHRLSKQFSDSLNLNLYNESVSKLQTELEFDRQEAKIQLLSAENKQKESKFNSLLISIVLIVIIAIVIWNRYYAVSKLANLVKKKNEELEQKNEILEQNSVKLKQLNETKDKFFSIIAHDIRNPLSVIIGISSLVKDNQIELDDDEYDELNAEIHNSAVNLNDLLQNLLLWSLAQRDLISFNPEKVNLKAVVENIISLFKLNASHKQIRMNLQITTELVIYADLNMLSTILRNLISNAIKYSQLNSEININAYENQETATIEIIDQGVGNFKSFSEPMSST